MASNVTRMPRQQMAAPRQQMAMPQQQMLVPGAQQGNWFWDGSNWNCGCDDGSGNFPFCPPPGFPPAGCPPWFSGMNSPPWYPGANAGISFGTAGNFPSNPVRGHFFWDGVSLWMFDGAAWVAVGGSSVPSKGVTDGSFAAPGMIGEVIEGTVSGNTTLVTGNIVKINLSPLVLPPGDWTVMSNLIMGGGQIFNVLYVQLNNTTGVIGAATNTIIIVGDASFAENTYLPTAPVAISVAAATLLNWTVTLLNNQTATSNPTYDFVVWARRSR